MEVVNARRTDPIPSHLAGIEVEANGQAAIQRTLAYNAVKEYPRQTSMELAYLTGYSRYMLARRLPELDGLVQGDDRYKRKCRITGRLSVIWELRND